MGEAALAAAPPGLWRAAGRRLRTRAAARVSVALLVLLVALALLGPWLSPWRFDSLDWRHLASPPGSGAAHWFGTDRLGRDLFVRTLMGLRLSLLVSVLATLVSLAIGVSWGRGRRLCRRAHR